MYDRERILKKDLPVLLPPFVILLFSQSRCLELEAAAKYLRVVLINPFD